MKRSYQSFLTIVVAMFACIYFIATEYVPYFHSVYKKVQSLYDQYTVSKNSKNIGTEIQKVTSEIHVIDSLLNRQILRESEVKTGLVEALYNFADSAQFKTSKVEIGEKIVVAGRNETSISVNGAGNYECIGKFVEHIENYPRSTRVRQIVLKGTAGKAIDGFVDFVLME